MGHTTAGWRSDEGRLTDVATEAGFEALFAAEYGAMVRLAVLLLGNEGEAEEVVQDAFDDPLALDR